jgi:hypothetical protein
MISCLCSYVHIDSWPSWGHRWLLGQLPCSRQEAVRAHLAESSQKVKFKKNRTTTQTFWRFQSAKFTFCVMRRVRIGNASSVLGQTQASNKKI